MNYKYIYNKYKYLELKYKLYRGGKNYIIYYQKNN